MKAYKQPEVEIVTLTSTEDITFELGDPSFEVGTM